MGRGTAAAAAAAAAAVAAAAAAAAAAACAVGAGLSFCDGCAAVCAPLMDHVFMSRDGIIESKQKHAFHKTSIFLVLFDGRNRIALVFPLF